MKSENSHSANRKRNTILKAIKHKKDKYFPTQIIFTKEMREKICQNLQVRNEKLEELLDNHIYMITPNQIISTDSEKGIEYDNWGIGWDKKLTEGFLVRYRPLENWDFFNDYKLPNLTDPILFQDIEKKIHNLKQKGFVVSDHGFCLFEKAHCLRGFENVLTDFYFEKKRINKLLDIITEYQMEVAKRFVKMGVDGGYTGDDFGSQRGLLFSPKIYREFLKSRYKKIWGVYKNAGLPVIHHSCGDVREILPDMIDIGLDVLNPVQPQAMPIEKLSEEFGKDLTFLGGISTQKTLPFGTPEQVKEEINKSVEILGKNFGYIISPSHEMTSDIPIDNFYALLETLHEYNPYIKTDILTKTIN